MARLHDVRADVAARGRGRLQQRRVLRHRLLLLDSHAVPLLLRPSWALKQG
jgi:hypothetical protein